LFFSKSSRYFIARVDSTGATTAISELFGIAQPPDRTKTLWIDPQSGINRLLLAGNKLSLITLTGNNTFSITQVSDDVQSAVFLNTIQGGSPHTAYLVDKEGTGLLYIYDNTGSHIAARLPSRMMPNCSHQTMILLLFMAQKPSRLPWLKLLNREPALSHLPE